LTIALLIMFMAGCASSAKKTAPAPQQPVKKDVSLNDTALFEEGLSYLNQAGGKPDYIKAKINFEVLVIAHPKSKWRPLSETLIQLIDNVRLGDEKLKSDLQLIEKLQSEKTRLTRELERYKSENNALVQENEQLKKDIRLLKNLELQLEKRRERSVSK
jgi:hypothetical protein